MCKGYQGGIRAAGLAGRVIFIQCEDCVAAMCHVLDLHSKRSTAVQRIVTGLKSPHFITPKVILSLSV